MLKLFKSPPLDKQMQTLLEDFRSRQVQLTLEQHRLSAQLVALEHQIGYLEAKLCEGVPEDVK